jgi:hypothetical protein
MLALPAPPLNKSLSDPAVGQDLGELLPQWKPEELHLLVANFLYVRFPMLLALNKVGWRPSATRAAMPPTSLFCCSAALSRWT